MANYVLVHGGWRGGWVWEETAKHLRKSGHTVFTPTLTGLAERKHLLSHGINLTTHILDITHLIEFYDLQNVILVGHSYSGVVITGVAEQMPERIATLLYLDAFVPQNGDSIFSLSSDQFKLFASQTASGLGGLACLSISASQFGLPEQYHDLLEKKCTPHPMASVMEGLTVTGKSLSIKNKIYVLVNWQTSFPTPFTQFHERLKNDPEWRVLTLEGSHDVMIDNVDSVVKLLEEAI